MLGPLTCWVAVTGLAWCPRGPSVIVTLTVLTVWPGCVVTAVMAVPTVASAPEELPVKCALLGVPTTVAGCERWRFVCMSDRLCRGEGFCSLEQASQSWVCLVNLVNLTRPRITEDTNLSVVSTLGSDGKTQLKYG